VAALLQQVDAVARWIEQWYGQGAEPLGLHLEGPFLCTPGAHDAHCFVDPTPARLDELLAAARGTLRLVTLAHARPGRADATRRLVAAGVTVALGHCDRSDGFTACVDAGARASRTCSTSWARCTTATSAPPAGARRRTRALPVDPRRRARAPGDGAQRVPHPRPRPHRAGHRRRRSRRHARRRLHAERHRRCARAAAWCATQQGPPRRLGADDGAGRAQLPAMVPMAGPWTLARVAATNPAALLGTAGERFGSLQVGKRAAFTLLGDDGSFRCVR
jgi:hypothetical protein